MIARKKKIEVQEVSTAVENTTAILEELLKGVTAEEAQQYIFISKMCEGKNVVELNHGYSYGAVCKGFADGVKSLIAYSHDREKVAKMKKVVTGNVICRYSDMEKIDCGDGLADVVVAFDVIQYLTNPDKLIEEAKRILSPDGVLIISASVYQGMHFVDSKHLKEYSPTQFIGMVARRFGNVKQFKMSPMPLTEVQDGWFDGQTIVLVAKKIL